jgi:hypothetical protein
VKAPIIVSDTRQLLLVPSPEGAQAHMDQDEAKLPTAVLLGSHF